jgi:predicted ATPase/DNA-binding XRE family transcriptional regulator
LWVKVCVGALCMTGKGSFGQWLKQRRKALGLTQKELAQQAGCAEVSLRKIEAGDLHPSPPLVASLARAAGAAEGDLPALLSLARGVGDDFTARARLLRPQRPHNLPAQLTPLIGREHDITAMRRRLIGDGARLVTLVGPPGVGKTRLALAVAEDAVEQFEHGAFFVRLGPVSDPAQVASAIAQALGMEMSGPNPPALQLRAWLEEKHLLLVLDNFEQIVAAAPLVDDLLRRCPWLHVLVTSRQPLRVRGERQMPVHPLALPVAQPGDGRLPAADALRYAAVALFAERAEAVQPDFVVSDDNAAAVTELCRRLDGLPLAIELVAARVKLLPLAELLARLHGPWLLSADGLRDVSARQRTLRGAIGWSFDLLSPDEQALFTYLSIFVGGFTLEAAELLCGDILSPPLPLTFSPAQVLDGIASLLDKSLLHRETGLYGDQRYVMLETVREFGLERTKLGGQEAELRKRHASCFLELIEDAEQVDLSPRRLKQGRLIDDDVHNVRAALTWAMQHDVQAALSLTIPVLRWLTLRGPLTEGRQLIEDVFALPGAREPTIPRARALREAGVMLFSCDEPDSALSLVEESLHLSRELGYEKGEADAMLGMGDIVIRAVNWLGKDQARKNYETALAIYQRLGDTRGIASANEFLANHALNHAEFQRARVFAEESLAIAKTAGFTLTMPLFTLANIVFYGDCDLEKAKQMYQQVLNKLRQEHEGKRLIANTIFQLADIAIRRRHFDAARAYLQEAMGIANQLRMPFIRIYYVWFAELSQAEGNFEEAIHWYRACLPQAVIERWSWAIILIDLAMLTETLGMHELAAKQLGAVEFFAETIAPLSALHLKDLHQVTNAIRSHLDEEHFDAAWAEGRGLAFDQVAEEAVSTLEAALDVPEHSLPK